MLDQLLKHLIREMGTSGSSGVDLSTLLRHAAEFHAEHDQRDPSSSTRPSQKIDDQYLRFLWNVLTKQQGVVVGRTVANNNRQPSKQPSLGPAVSTDGLGTLEPGTPSAKGKERETPATDDGEDQPVQLDDEGLPMRVPRFRTVLPGQKGKQSARTHSKGDVFELLDPDEYLDVRLDDLKEKYDNLRIALDSEKMFYVLTGSYPGHIKMSEIIYQALSLIAGTKETGLDAVALGRHLGQDQRMVFYYVKSLLDLNLIYKFHVTAHQSTTFNLVHYHYVDKNDEQRAYAIMAIERPQYEDPARPFLDFPTSMQHNTLAVEKRILDGLSVRSRGLVRSATLATDLGLPREPEIKFRRALQRTVRKLVEDGLIRRVKVVNTRAGGVRRRYRALQLVQASTSSEPKQVADGEDDGEVVADDDAGSDMDEDVDPSQATAPGGSDGRVADAPDVADDEAEMDIAGEVLLDEGEMLGVPDEEAVPTTSRFEPEARLSNSIPIERQIVQLVHDSGPTGMTFTELTDKIRIARRYLDIFSEHHCASPSAPPNLSHLNLVAISDFTGKERNLVVYTIENWLLNCKKARVEPDPKKQPPPHAQARGFLDLSVYELWTTKKKREQWLDSYANPKLPGITPYSSLRGGSRSNDGPGGRQGRAKAPHQRGRPARAGQLQADGSVTKRLVNPFALHNKTLPSHTTLKKDAAGEYILVAVLTSRGPGQATITALQDVLSGRADCPSGGIMWDRLAKAGSHYGIRVPGLVPDDYGNDVDASQLGPITGKLGSLKPPAKAPKPAGQNARKRKRVTKDKDGSGDEDENEVDELGSPKADSTPAPKKPRGRPRKTPKTDSTSQPPEGATPGPSSAPKRAGKAKKSLAAEAEPAPASPTHALDQGDQPMVESAVSVARHGSEAPATAEVSMVVVGGPSQAEPADQVVETDLSRQQRPMEEAASSLLQLSTPRANAEKLDSSPAPPSSSFRPNPSISATPHKSSPRPSQARGIGLRENLVFAVQKRDQQVIDWIKDCGGIVELVHGARSILQVFLDRQAAAEGPNSRTKASSTMDKRTFSVSIDRLVDKGQLKVKRIAIESGQNDMVTTKVAHLAELDKAQVDAFVGRLSRGPRPAKQGPVPGEMAKREVVEIETLEMDLGEEEKTRRQLRAEQVNKTLTLDEVLAVGDDQEAVHRLFSTDWRAVSQQYGFITGVFARTALFHREMLKMLESDPSEAVVSAEQRVFSMADTIAALSLGTYLKLISIPSTDSDLARFVATEAGRQTKMRDVPRSLRVILTVDRALTFEKFQKMIQSLYYFKLAVPYIVAPVDKPHDLEVEVRGEADPALFKKDLSVHFTHFQLLARSAPLYAIGNGEHPSPLVDVAPIETPDDVVDFWSRMEEYALNESEAPSGPFSPSFSVFPATCGYPNVRAVARTVSWTSTYVLGPIQRDFLAHQAEQGLASAGPGQEDIGRLSYLTAAPESAVEQFVGHYIRKRQRTREAAAKRKQEAERVERARLEKSTREKLAAKRAEQRIQLEEDWSALARKYLVTNKVDITDQLAKNLRGLRDVELADTTRSHLDAGHIAEVVQEMLDTEPARRPKPKPPAPPAPVRAPAPAPARAPAPAPAVRPPRQTPRERQLAATRDRTSSAKSSSQVVVSHWDDPEPGDETEMGKEEDEPAQRARLTVPCKLVTADDDYLIPDFVRELAPSGPLEPGRRRARLQYTDEFDDLILDIGAILLGRATRPGCRLVWKPAEKIVASVPRGTVRVRFMKLRDDPLTAAYVERLKDAYIDLWRTHRKTEAMPDPPKYQAEQFDIEHHLKFFRKNVDKNLIRANAFGAKAPTEGKDSDGRVTIVPSLPSTIRELEATWSFKRTQAVSNAPIERDDWRWLHERKVPVSEEMNEQRMAGIQLYIDPGKLEPQFPQPPQEWLTSSVDTALAAATLKMTLNVPESMYNSQRANAILGRKENKETIVSVTRALISASLITKKAQHITSRPHHLNLVNSNIEGPLSKKFFSETWKVEDQGGEAAILLEEEMSTWPFTASEGAVGALLSLCAENRVELNVDLDDVATLAARGVQNTKKLEDIDIEMHVHGRITAPPHEASEVDSPAAGPLETLPSAYGMQELEAAVAEMQDSPSIVISDNALPLQEALRAAGKEGLDWDQLLALPNFDPALTPSRVIALSRAFSWSSPPLAFWAGYDQARLVSSAFIKAWTVVIPPVQPSRAASQVSATNSEAEDEAQADQTEDGEATTVEGATPVRKVAESREAARVDETEVEDGTLIYPKRWLNLEGEIVEPEWEKSVRCVIGWIMARPTSESLLRYYLEGTFDRPELSDLLRFLLQEGIAKRTLVIDPADEGVKGVFGKGDEDDFGEVGWLSREQEKRVLWQVVEGRWLDGFVE